MWPEKEILFKTYAYPFLSLKISFKNCKKIRKTHFNISVRVNKECSQFAQIKDLQSDAFW